MSASLTYVSCIHIATARGEEDRMGSPHQTPSLIHDPLGLLALPTTAPGNDPPDDDAPRPGDKSAGVAIATNMLRGAMSDCSLWPVASHCLVPQTTSPF